MGTLEQAYRGTCDICGKEADAEVEASSRLDMPRFGLCSSSTTPLQQDLSLLMALIRSCRLG